MEATYTKLRSGAWGLRIKDGEVEAHEGATITVTKKSGETRQETIGRILWEDDGVCLCTIAERPKRTASGRSIT